jgi:hypothetical protein
VIESCHACHDAGGVQGLNVYTRSFGGGTRTPPILKETTPAAREEASIYWKRTRHDWGLFEGLSVGRGM